MGAVVVGWALGVVVDNHRFKMFPIDLQPLADAIAQFADMGNCPRPPIGGLFRRKPDPGKIGFLQRATIGILKGVVLVYRLQVTTNPGRQSAAADRDNHCVQRSKLIPHLLAHGPLAGDNVQIVVG